MTLTALRAIERGAAAPNLRALARLVLALGDDFMEGWEREIC